MGKTINAKKKAISEKIAEFLIIPLVTSLDLATAMRPDIAEEMRERLVSMREKESVMAAFPTPETMRKAEELRVDSDLFEAMLKLVEKRAIQQEFKHQETAVTPGAAILRQMGF